jgi:sporulation protein YlmC with PRC-barrel domain
MRLTDLRDKQVRSLDGKRLGRVHEVHCEKGAVTALMVGLGSLIERLTGRKHGRLVPWECVRKISGDEILVTANPPKRKPASKPASGSRTRPRTRRPSGPRSKR